MGLFTKHPTIAVHDGKFHADDIFACAALGILLKGNTTIIRTRDQKLIEAADYVVDVGGIDDPTQKRFDHHMPGGAGMRDTGIPYASFGLVWKEYGAAISGTPEIAARIDQKLVCPIDADDNGVFICEPKGDILPYTLQNFLYMYRPTWKESDTEYDSVFPRLVRLAEEIIQREIVIARDTIAAKDIVEKAYQDASDKRIVILSTNCPSEEVLSAYPEPLFVIAPRRGSDNWGINIIPLHPKTFQKRKFLPEAWAGLRDNELEKVTGIEGAIFCHNGRFLAVAKTKEAALALAKLALEAKP